MKHFKHIESLLSVIFSLIHAHLFFLCIRIEPLLQL